jgi:hypothetical protein
MAVVEKSATTICHGRYLTAMMYPKKTDDKPFYNSITVVFSQETHN